jgi:OOP family OmpA-OmpF porin
MNTKHFKLLFGLTLIAATSGCASSVQKADIPSNANPTEEISKLEADLSYGQNNEFDVLAHNDFQASKDKLATAKEKLKDDKKQEDVLDQIRYSRAYYERAKTTAESRKSKVETVLTARNAALDAGVAKYPALSDEWKDVENDARKLSEKKSEDIDVKDIKSLQNRYAELQFQAIKMNFLGDAKAKLVSAKDHKAESRASKTYKQAQIDYAAAETTISANRTTPNRFMPEVDRANASAKRLERVMEYTKKDGKNFNEDAAVQLVMQEDRIHGLDNQLDRSKETLDRSQENLNRSRENNVALENQATEMNGKIKAQGQKLSAAERQVAMQQAIDSARKEFKPSEADVYQQGEQLLIRMKSINFATGKSDLPENAEGLLNKVEMIAKDLSASDIMVQGHTDATGSKDRNLKLSEDRAEKVAGYLEKNTELNSKIATKGYGDTTPLTTNKTKAGRAQNRRIDIVITPSGQM